MLSVLKKSLDQGEIFFYAVIRHAPEEDTKKEHFHFFVSPSKPLDFISFRRRFIEPCDDEKPLNCLPFQTSKLSDWILYALHDIQYLNKKGLLRINHYSLENFFTNDEEYLLQSYNDAKEAISDSRMNLFLAAVRRGSSFGEILRSGVVPPNQIVYWEKVYRSSLSLFGKDVDNKQIIFQPNI